MTSDNNRQTAPLSALNPVTALQSLFEVMLDEYNSVWVHVQPESGGMCYKAYITVSELKGYLLKAEATGHCREAAIFYLGCVMHQAWSSKSIVVNQFGSAEVVPTPFRSLVVE